MGLPNLNLAAADASKLQYIGGRLMNVLRDSDGEAHVEDAFSGKSQPRRVFESLVGADGVEQLESVGVLTPISEGLSSRYALVAIRGKLFFTDPPRSRFVSEPLYVDPLWEAPAFTRMLLTESAETGIDIGCGCGALAIALADHCRTVYASDVNPRAIELCKLNTMINDASNVIVLESDLFNSFAPDVKFDHIVFNSPTGTEFSSRHLLRMGEGIFARFFQELPTRTNPDAIVQTNMCVKDWPGDAFFDRMSGWLGPHAGEFNHVYTELYRREGGVKFLLYRLRGALRHGPTAMKCRAERRGWLTMRKRPGGRSWILPTNYHLWVHDAPGNAPEDLIRTCLAAVEAAPNQNAIPATKKAMPA